MCKKKIKKKIDLRKLQTLFFDAEHFSKKISPEVHPPPYDQHYMMHNKNMNIFLPM